MSTKETQQSRAKRTYQVVYWHDIEGGGAAIVDRRIVAAGSPQEAVVAVTLNRGSLPGFEVSNVLEIANGWAVRQGKVVSK